MTVYDWREAPAADFAVIGHPVEHSRSPQMHQAAYAALNLPYRYVAIAVPPQDLLPALDHLAHSGYRGLNVTVPHKAAVMEWLREADDVATRAGSANTVDLVGRRGTSTDGLGFADVLKESGLEAPAGILLLGAGGTTRALLPVLLDSGFRVGLWNRTRERADEVAMGLPGIEVLDEPDPSRYDGIVNATSATVQGQGLVLDWSGVNPGAVAFDLGYGKPSSFLESAREAGLRALDGLPLLVAQGARSFEWWLGVEAPRHAMAEAVR